MPARGMNDSGLSAAQAIFFVENKDALKKVIEEFGVREKAAQDAEAEAWEEKEGVKGLFTELESGVENLSQERADFEAAADKSSKHLENVKAANDKKKAEIDVQASELSAERSAFNVAKDQFDADHKELALAVKELEAAEGVIGAREAAVEEDENLIIVDRMELDDEKAALIAALGSLL